MMDDIKDDGTAASAAVQDEAPPPKTPAKPLRSVGPESEVRGGSQAPDQEDSL